jgi:hypothetical protein
MRKKTKLRTPDPSTIPSGTVVQFTGATKPRQSFETVDGRPLEPGSPLPADYKAPPSTPWEKKMDAAVASDASRMVGGARPASDRTAMDEGAKSLAASRQLAISIARKSDAAKKLAATARGRKR